MKSLSLPKSFNLSDRFKFSQRRAFWGIVVIGVAILIYFLGVLPLLESAEKTKEEILLKKRALLRYDEFLQNRKRIEEDLNRAVKQYEEIQRRLLPGETPQLGAATLQEIIKRLSEKNGISIRSFRILDSKETGLFRKVSIRIDFNPTNSMLSLGQFIYDIENHEKGFVVSEMDLIIFNPRMPSQIQGSLVVSGLMKAAATAREKGKEG